jgi:hypothetical protein
MTRDLDYSLPPAVRRIANTFRWVGWVSVWVQVVLGIISSLVLLFAVASISIRSGSGGNPGTSAGLFMAVVGLLVVYFGAFWAFRYTRLARSLRSRDATKRPKPKDMMQALKLGLFISLGGMLVSLLGAQASSASCWPSWASCWPRPCLNPRGQQFLAGAPTLASLCSPWTFSWFKRVLISCWPTLVALPLPCGCFAR